MQLPRFVDDLAVPLWDMLLRVGDGSTS